MAQQSQSFLENQPVDSSCQRIYFTRKPALDQSDSRIDRAAATSSHTVFLFPCRAITFDHLSGQIQHLHWNLQDSDVFCSSAEPERGPH